MMSIGSINSWMYSSLQPRIVETTLTSLMLELLIVVTVIFTVHHENSPALGVYAASTTEFGWIYPTTDMKHNNHGRKPGPGPGWNTMKSTATSATPQNQPTQTMTPQNQTTQTMTQINKAWQRPEFFGSDNGSEQFGDFEGEIVGWRDVDGREFPYVVSIMHGRYHVHICTGVLLSSKVVLTYIQCVIRRKSVADRVIYKLAETNQIIVATGTSSNGEKPIHVEVDVIVTAYHNPFKGRLVFLMLKGNVPYSIYHRPVKMYSMNPLALGAKLQEYVGKSFCEVVTWEDALICLDMQVIIPKDLKAYKIQILESSECSQQDFRLGVQAFGDWRSMKEKKYCFTGRGGIRCGSAPGGPVICGNALYGIMSLGTSCGEFGDYTLFVPLNDTEMYFLYKKTTKLEIIKERELQNGNANLTLHFPIVLISTMYLYLYLTTK